MFKKSYAYAFNPSFSRIEGREKMSKDDTGISNLFCTEISHCKYIMLQRVVSVAFDISNRSLIETCTSLNRIFLTAPVTLFCLDPTLTINNTMEEYNRSLFYSVRGKSVGITIFPLKLG